MGECQGGHRLAEVSVSKRCGVPAKQVWARIGDPASLAEWHPFVERTELVDDGQRRINTTVDGGRFTETILERGDRHHTWRIDEGPLPYESFVGIIRVRDDGKGHCLVECEATFEPMPGAEDQAAELTRGFFQAGLDAVVEGAA